MSDNRRSTNQIVSILNNIRTDIHQNNYRNIDGAIPKIFIGDLTATHEEAKRVCQDANVYTLSRDNITSNAMKKDVNGRNLNAKLFTELQEADKPSSNNKYRSSLIIACLKAVELSHENKFKEAIKELEKRFKSKTDIEFGKREALKHLNTLLSNYETYKDGSLYDFFIFTRENIKSDISNLINRGAAKPFYESHSYQEMALCVKVPEDISQHKTIHKAKGDEFNNVMLVLKDERNLSFLLAPDVITSEEQRVNYVAVSRARENLFISIPTLSVANRATLGVNFQIEDV